MCTFRNLIKYIFKLFLMLPQLAIGLLAFVIMIMGSILALEALLGEPIAIEQYKSFY